MANRSPTVSRGLVAWLATLLTVWSLAAVAHAAEVTEAAVLALVERVDRAVANKDVLALGQAISDNVDMSVQVTMAGRTQTMRMTKSEYLQAFREIWDAGGQLVHRRTNTKIRPMGKSAVVTYDSFEQVTMRGQPAVTSNASLTVTIEEVKGVLQMTRIRGSGSMK